MIENGHRMPESTLHKSNGFFYPYKVRDQSGSLRAVEGLSVCFECPLLDTYSSNNGRHGYGGGRHICQSKRSQYTSI